MMHALETIASASYHSMILFYFPPTFTLLFSHIITHMHIGEGTLMFHEHATIWMALMRILLPTADHVMA